MIAAPYHERQQKLSCDVWPADLGLVGNSSAVAVVAVNSSNLLTPESSKKSVAMIITFVCLMNAL